MYVAVKGGETAIHNAHKLLADRRRGDRSLPSLTLAQIAEQLALACDRVMAEGSVYDRELAALAIKQARGDLIEAIFLLRAYRTTLPRFGYSVPIDTGAMHVERRVSATYKDLPGGQMLGPTFDYTHRLLDPELAGDEEVAEAERREGDDTPVMRVSDILAQEGLIEEDGDVPGDEIGDLTRTPMDFPMARDTRLQALARGDEGFLLALGYSTQRGYGRTHPFVGEIRIGEVAIAQGAFEQAHSLIYLGLRHTPFAGGDVIVGPDGVQTAIQSLLLEFQELDRNPGIGKVHGDAPAHGAGANYCYRANGPSGRRRVDPGHLECLPFGEEQVLLRPSLGRSHAFPEQ